MRDGTAGSHYSVQRVNTYCMCLQSSVRTHMPRILIVNIVLLLVFTCTLVRIYVSSVGQSGAEISLSGDEYGDSFEEVDINELEKQSPNSRALPSGYIWTLELYRNRLRYMKGEDKRLLTADDLREGYGRFKIPYKEEIKAMLQSYEDKV